MSENYIAELEKINSFFGGKSTIKWKEVWQYTGRGRRWCTAHIKVPHNGCTTVQLAKALANLK